MLHPLMLVAVLPSVAALRLAVPRTPTEMVDMAAAAVRAAREAGKNRLVVDLIVPQLDSEEVYGFFTEDSVPTGFIVKPEDLDPWPGGLKQQYPFAVDLARQCLRKAVGTGASVKDQVVDAEDACGLLIAQAETAADDVACLLFPGADQLAALEQMDASCGPRTLIVLNKQFRRPADFGLNRGRADAAFFDRGFETAYALEEFACRGEDVKLVGAFPSQWKAFVFLNDGDTEGSPLFGGEALTERPTYAELEREINRAYPTPRWARKLDEVEEKGLNFRR